MRDQLLELLLIVHSDLFYLFVIVALPVIRPTEAQLAAHYEPVHFHRMYALPVSIALGSGMQVQDVNKLLKQYDQMNDMMKKLSSKGGMMKLMRSMGGKMPPGMMRSSFLMAFATNSCAVPLPAGTLGKT